MLSFELREKQGGFELTGGDLEEPLFYDDQEPVASLVGFLSQKDGSELTIIAKDGTVIATKCWEPTIAKESNVLGLL